MKACVVSSRCFVGRLTRCKAILVRPCGEGKHLESADMGFAAHPRCAARAATGHHGPRTSSISRAWRISIEKQCCFSSESTPRRAGGPFAEPGKGCARQRARCAPCRARLRSSAAHHVEPAACERSVRRVAHPCRWNAYAHYFSLHGPSRAAGNFAFRPLQDRFPSDRRPYDRRMHKLPHQWPLARHPSSVRRLPQRHPSPRYALPAHSNLGADV